MGNIVLETEGLFDPNEAAKEIGIGYATLYRWIKKGLLSPVKIAGRNYIPISEIERLKNARGPEAR